MGIIEQVVDRILNQYGITEEQIDKAKKLLDSIDIRETSDGVLIHIKMKDFQVIINK